MSQADDINILILFYSKYGTTEVMAQTIAEGVILAGGKPTIRTVPEISSVTTDIQPSIPKEGALYCTEHDLIQCDGLILGSPTRFGNMASPLKYFFDSQTTSVWLSGQLQGKPASVFTASGTLHGGQESTLLTMMIPLLHHGMVIMGLPYSLPELTQTATGGTPYGVSRVTGVNHQQTISNHEKQLCIAQGKRMVDIAKRLKK